MFLERRKTFVFFGAQVRSFQQNSKCMELRIVKSIGKNHLAHYAKNKLFVKKLKDMQIESSRPQNKW